MQTVSLVLALVGLVVGVLGLIGVILGKVPLLKLKGRGLAAGVLVGGLALAILGGNLAPRRTVTVTASPASATILIDGKTYTGTTGELPLLRDSYEVEIKAPRHHALKQTLDVSKQQKFNIALAPFSSEELAAIQRQADLKAEQARQAQLAKPQAKAAALKAEQARVVEEQRAKAAAAKQAVIDAAAAKKQAVINAVAAQAKAEREASLIGVGVFWIRCKEAVRAQLKSPDSAKFPSVMTQPDQTKEFGDGSKIWASSIQAQNAFGTEVNNEFTCTYNPTTRETVAKFR
ncbi:hypothetical protein GCM10022631_22150 [Deinococcus rubellus]|uniref:PEGA domain-containing protein n=1 Tax=Deinococcus rubellus TaxID=1889240 RepID=A0ABY5YKS5_9DEIO|nr:PEGA domain-containing protein [Deinococcus rubellus]UWX65689.1 PEGA domain-containing protein [Deinococcus rubellus]